MATNHEVGSSNLSERAIFLEVKDAPEQCSGAFLLERKADNKRTQVRLKQKSTGQTSAKLPHVTGFLSVREAAHHLGISPSTVTRWCESGKLPAVAKPYGKTITYLISPTALEMLIHAEQQKKQSRERQGKHELSDNKKPHESFKQGWLAAMEKGLITGKPFSPNTINSYKANLEAFLAQHSELSVRTLQIALMSIGVHQYAKKARLYEALICFGKYLHRQGAIENTFFDEVRHFKPKRNLPAKRLTVNEESLEILLRACRTPLDRLSIIIPVCTGLRASEMCSLLWSDIDIEKRSLTVRLGKGNKTRRVGLSTLAIDALTEHLNALEGRQAGPVFINRIGKPMDRSGLRQRVERIGKDAGIPVSPHALRRAFVTINANKGRPLQMLQMACGHSDIKTTMSYCRTQEQEVIEAMKDWD